LNGKLVLSSGIICSIVAILFIIPFVYATEHESTSVDFSGIISVPEGSGVSGCDYTNECFLPFNVSVLTGEEITWSNDDSSAHTVTSGSPSDGPDGNFDSGLIIASDTFSVTLDESGQYPYYCMIHPWARGMLIVEDNYTPFSLKTDKNEYKNGDTITISGIANPPYFFDRQITGVIVSPDDRRIIIMQLQTSHKYFETSFKIGGTMTDPGEYIATFWHGYDKNQIIINYVDEEPIITCDESYPDVCIVPYPPDLNCGDIEYRNFRVTGEDPHRFDGDNDGIGCES